MSVWETIGSARAKRRQRLSRSHPAPDLPRTQSRPDDDAQEELDQDEVEGGVISSEDDSQASEHSADERVPPSQKQNLSEGELSDSETESEASTSQRQQSQQHDPNARPPREIARAIEFPELLDWLSSRTSFSTGPPAKARKPPVVRMQSQDEPETAPQPFVALSVSPAIVAFAAKKVDEFAASPGTAVVGTMPSVPRGNLKAYQFTTDDITLAPLSYPEVRLPWMPQVNARSRAWVQDRDLVVFEQIGRETTALLSYLDAFLAGISVSLDATPGADPFAMRSISMAGNILAELTAKASTLTQYAVVHRRDLFLNGCRLSPEHISALRLAPFLPSTTLFEQPLLKRITDEHLEQTKNEALTRVIRQAAPAPAKQHSVKKPLTSPKSAQKRSTTSTSQGSVEKKAKYVAPPATPVHSTSTPRVSKKHR